MNYHAIVNLLFKKGLLKKIPITIPLQNLHLLNGNLIEFNKPFALWYSIVDGAAVEQEASDKTILSRSSGTQTRPLKAVLASSVYLFFRVSSVRSSV